MTVDRRGMRTITVDGHVYVWRVRRAECPCCESGSLLIADASRRGSVVMLPGPDYGDPDEPITPRMIAEYIREARRSGWEPGQGRGVFTRDAGSS